MKSNFLCVALGLTSLSIVLAGELEKPIAHPKGNNKFNLADCPGSGIVQFHCDTHKLKEDVDAAQKKVDTLKTEKLKGHKTDLNEANVDLNRKKSKLKQYLKDNSEFALASNTKFLDLDDFAFMKYQKEAFEEYEKWLEAKKVKMVDSIEDVMANLQKSHNEYSAAAEEIDNIPFLKFWKIAEKQGHLNEIEKAEQEYRIQLLKQKQHLQDFLDKHPRPKQTNFEKTVAKLYLNVAEKHEVLEKTNEDLARSIETQDSIPFYRLFLKLKQDDIINENIKVAEQAQKEYTEALNALKSFVAKQRAFHHQIEKLGDALF